VRRQGGYADAPRPDLILLDLNLPGKDGLQVLTELKEDEVLKPIAVVVLTGSCDEEDILHNYQHHADGYLTKPIHRAHFLRVVHNVEGFWLALASRLPGEPR
jgi:CheY-like chemotaxis protein